MLARRAFFISAIALLAAAPAFAQAPPANDPLAIINAIYARVIAGTGDGGGGFIMDSKAAKAKYLSKALIALWAKADARTPKDDVGPVDFDLATNSQDPSVKSFTAAAEKSDSGSATIAVKLGPGDKNHAPRAHAEDNTIRYDFVRDGGHWKIDDIRGAVDAKPWSLREILAIASKG